MPIYEFKCSNCGEVCELIMKINSEPSPCKACGYNTLVKVPSRIGFTINGFSEANGYSSAPDISYDGVDREW